MSVIILNFDLAELTTEESRILASDKIIHWIERGYTPLVVLSYSENFIKTILSDTFFSHKLKHKTYINSRDEDLIGFCQGIISATILSHMLKARGQKVITFTGIQTGLFTCSEKQKCLFINTKKIKYYLEIGNVVIISGLNMMSENGELMTLGKTELPAFIDFLNSCLKDKFNLKRTEYSYLYSISDGIKENKLQDFLILDQGANLGIFRKENPPLEKQNVVSGIMVAMNVFECKFDFSNTTDPHKKRLSILHLLASHDISLDMINICYDSLYFITNQNFLPLVKELLEKESISFSYKGKLVKLSISGVGMKGTPGVMANIYGALESTQVEVLRNTDSHITISCIIEEEDLPTALEALIDKFDLERQDIVYENKLE